jgi:hypothetical protein
MLPQVDELIRILQLAISPVVLISGVGLLILSMTNRMAHLIDRIRSLHAEIRRTGDPDKSLDAQMEVLLKRSWLIKTGLLMFVLCILIDAMVVIMLFLIKLSGIGVGWLIALLFSASLLAMIAGLVLFIIDVSHNLWALRIEVGKQ